MPDDDEDSPLRGGDYTGKMQQRARWPWVLLGLFFGLLTVLFTSSSPAASAKAVETTCGSVPSSADPMVRRKLDGKVRNVLVTGAGGFIASHFSLALIDQKGFNLTVVDDMSRGSMDTIIRLQVLQCPSTFFLTPSPHPAPLAVPEAANT